MFNTMLVFRGNSLYICRMNKQVNEIILRGYTSKKKKKGIFAPGIAGKDSTDFNQDVFIERFL